MYVHREIEPLLQSSLSQHAVLLLVGPRGSGKTTLLKHCPGEGCQFLSTDDVNAMDTTLAGSDEPLAEGCRTLVLEDAERRPGLVRRLVAAAVADARPGRLVLEAALVTERLSAILQPFVAHVRTLRIGTLSLRELLGQTGRGPHVPAPPRNAANTPIMDEGALWEQIWRGGQPALLGGDANWDDFYSTWERELLSNEVGRTLGRRDSFRFLGFMTACARQTARPLDLGRICAEAEVGSPTAETWVHLLEELGIVCLVRPLPSAPVRHLGSQAGRTPLLHFMDTGLACHLTSQNTSDDLRSGQLYRPMFHSFVVSEIIKSHLAAGRSLSGFSHLRNDSDRDLDLVLREGDVLHPIKIDIGRAALVDAAQREFSSLRGVDGCALDWGEVVCLAQDAGMAGRGVVVTPAWQV